MTKAETRAIRIYLNALKAQYENRISETEEKIKDGWINKDIGQERIETFKTCITDINLKLDLIK